MWWVGSRSEAGAKPQTTCPPQQEGNCLTEHEQRVASMGEAQPKSWAKRGQLLGKALPIRPRANTFIYNLVMVKYQDPIGKALGTDRRISEETQERSEADLCRAGCQAIGVGVQVGSTYGLAAELP